RRRSMASPTKLCGAWHDVALERQYFRQRRRARREHSDIPIRSAHDPSWADWSDISDGVSHGGERVSTEGAFNTHRERILLSDGRPFGWIAWSQCTDRQHSPAETGGRERCGTWPAGDDGAPDLPHGGGRY